MNIEQARFGRLAVSVALSLAVVGSALAAPEAASSEKPAFTFRDTAYFHRWSQNDQHEFTPEKQEDLEKWSDMITLNAYPDVHDGDGLAAKATAVLENYKAHGARVARTDSVPRTEDRPAEHLIVVIFAQPNFVEVAFARFKLIDDGGCSIVYSHRSYGAKASQQVNPWTAANGPLVEKALMGWNSAPSPFALGRELRRTRS
jgi:hypothetical protein